MTDELTIPEITDEELLSPNRKKPLTAREKLFVLHFCASLNRTRSALESGFTTSEEQARTYGARLYAKANVRAAIRREMDRRAKRVRMSTEKMVAMAEDSILRCAERADEDGVRAGFVLIAKLLGFFETDNKSKAPKVLMMNGVESNHELESCRERLRQRGVKIDEMKPKQLEGKPSNT